MTDNNYNIIKPVKSLQNIGNATAAKRREERKKRQNSHKQSDRQHEPVEDELNESTEKNIDSEINGNDENDQNECSLNYRA